MQSLPPAAMKAVSVDRPELRQQGSLGLLTMKYGEICHLVYDRKTEEACGRGDMFRELVSIDSPFRLTYTTPPEVYLRDMHLTRHSGLVAAWQKKDHTEAVPTQFTAPHCFCPPSPVRDTKSRVSPGRQLAIAHS